MNRPSGSSLDDTDAEIRRQSWRGLKAPVKRILSASVPHRFMRLAIAGRPAVARARLPAPARLRTVGAAMSGVTFVMLRPDRCILAKELYWGQGRRPDPVDQYALDVFGALARTADVVLDVGAYTGIFSLLAGSVSERGQIHAFEVVPEVMKSAWDNVAANDLATRIEVHLLGVGLDGRTTTMADGRGGSALPDFCSAQMFFPGGTRIPIASLDAIAARLGPWPESAQLLIKIDTEGGEADIIGQGLATIATYRPTVLCELLPSKARTAAVEAAFRDLGYRFFNIRAGGVKQHAALHALDDFRDWLITPLDVADLQALNVNVITDSGA